MSEMPDQISIQGDVSGQIAVGNYINQFQNLNGCNINITTPEQRPKWERRSGPAQIRPRPPDTFFDRTSEITLIDTSVHSVKPLAVIGMHGIGKTTLLKRLAHETKLDPFPDGIYSFSALDLKLEDLLQCLFSAFYDSNVPVKPDRAEVQKALQNIRALILIDDLQLSRDETMVMMDIAPGCMFIAALIGDAQQVTSGEIRLAGLPETDALLLFEKELGRSLAGDERKLASDICRHLEGHPEKLRWLAANIREEGLSLDEIAARLKEDAPDALLRDSVKRLPLAERQILAVLTGVEGTSLSQEHIAALVSAGKIQPALNNLAARGMIRAHEADFSVSEAVSGILAETWKLSDWEKGVIEHFVKWLEKKPSAARVAEVRETLSVLIRKAARRGMWAAVVILARSLEPILIQQGYWQAWNEILHSLLDASTSLGNRKLQGWALHQLGSRSLCLGTKDEAIRQLSEALSIRRSIGDKAGAALTEHNLSLISGVPPIEHSGEPSSLSSASNFVVKTGVAIATVSVAAVAVLAAMLLVGPSRPALALPENELTQTSGTGLVFEWKSVWRGTMYQVQLDEEEAFSSPLMDLTTGSTSLGSPRDLDQGIYYWRVRAVNRFNRAGNWSETRTFTISIPPDKVTLTRPSEESIETNPERLVFAWDRTDNSTSYLVQVDDVRDFSSPTEERRVAENSYPPTSALGQGIYYWRVRAINPYDTPGEWSDVWSFTISIAPATTPVLIEPSNGSVLETITRPGFRWGSVDNATDYRIQVSDSSTFNSLNYNELVSGTEVASIPDLEHGEYYWRAQAVNTFGTAGDWSSPWTFAISTAPDAPNLIRPDDSFVESTTTEPVYEWSEVELAISYQIQVDDGQGFSSPEYDEEVTDVRHTSSIELEQGEYFWRVRAINEFDTAGEWSETGTFIISIPPPAPALVAPATNTLLSTTNRPDFDWRGVGNATEYQIQVDNGSAFNSPEYQTTAPDTGRTPSAGLSQGLYSWRVRAINEYGTPGDWSQTWQFTISIPPAAPTLLAPANNAYVFSNSNIDFDWNSVQNANRYQIQVDNSSNFSSPTKDATQQGNDTDRTFVLSAGTYYWRVRAINLYDTPGNWSSSRSLNVIPPLAPPVLVSPAKNSQWNSSQVTFDWNGVAGASSYRIQVDNNSNFGSPEINTTNTSSQIYISSGLAPQGLPAGTYYFDFWWRVRAINQYGNSPWSSVWKVTLKVTYID